MTNHDPARQKPGKLAVFDLDGTLFRWQLYHELVFKLKDKGCFRDDVAEQLDEALLGWTSRRTSFHDYEKKMIKLFSSELPRIPTQIFDQTAKETVSSSSHKIYRYTHRLLKQLKEEGYFLLALSGSQQELVDQFAKLYGFDDWIGSLYERNERGFTGGIVRNVPKDKAGIVTAYADKHDYDLLDALAIGDSESDIGMLELVGTPIAFNPAGDLLGTAHERGWRIVVERKNIAYQMIKQPDGTLAVTDMTVY